jgi:predicted nucleotidyltransferase
MVDSAAVSADSSANEEFMSRRMLVIPEPAVEDFCRRYGVRRLSVFGSVVRSEQRPDSDVDVLVEFAPGHAPGFFGLSDMEAELSLLLGRKVDLNTPGFFSGALRDRVLAEAEVQYARAG